MSFDYFSQRRMQYILEKLKAIFDTKADASEVPSVIDNLTSTSTTDALSAKQGKVLKDSIDGLDIPSLLSDLSDVELTSLANGQIIKYNGTNQKWINSDFVNGHNTYFGTSEPSANTGVDNDIYIRVSNNDFGKSFRIYTTGTGGETANITVATIIEGVVTTSETIYYRQPYRTYSDFTTNYYSSNWHVTITSNNVMEHDQGEDISWGWSATKDMTLVINPPTIYGVYIKSRGTWLKISNDAVEVVDNLTTQDATKALSANQGKVLKDTIDGLSIPDELADLADDSTHRLVTDAEKTTWNNKSDFDGAYNSLTGKPTLGTASAKDVPTSGDASSSQVVMGNDTRLTDSRPASDVYDWAKASTKPTYTASEVGLGNVGNYKAVSTVANQGLTDTEKANSRANIGAGTSNFSGAYGDLSGKPTLGTASAKDVPTSGNASTTQVVMGNDTRLSDSRPASDVYSWAKAENKPTYNASEVGAIATTAKGSANGVAELDSTGKVPSSQLPSYVDDVQTYNSISDFPSTGEDGIIYIAKDTNKTYRWSGTDYVEISESLALGETSSTAYRGDRGKTAYDHSQTTSGNPHNVTKSDVGLGNVGNFKAVSTEASQGLTDTEKSNARTNIGAGTSSTDENVYQHATTTNADYRVLFSNGANNNNETAEVKKYSGFTFNPSSGKLSVNGYNSTTTSQTSIIESGNNIPDGTAGACHGALRIYGKGTKYFAIADGNDLLTDNRVLYPPDKSGTIALTDDIVDTKNTAGSTDTSSKIYLVGATTQAANPQTYSDNEVYVTSGVLTTKSVQVGGTAATMQYNSTNKCIDFVFS